MRKEQRDAIRFALWLLIFALGILIIVVAQKSGAQAVLNLVYGVVMWGAIPVTLLAYLGLAAAIPYRLTNPESRLSARAGFLAGLVLFAAYCVTYAPRVKNVDFTTGPLPAFSLLGAIFGLVTGFALLELIKRLLPSRGVGVLTLLMTSASAISLFSYLFRSSIRSTTLYFTLGSLFGGLLYVVLFPGSVQEIRSTRLL